MSGHGWFELDNGILHLRVEGVLSEPVELRTLVDQARQIHPAWTDRNPVMPLGLSLWFRARGFHSKISASPRTRSVLLRVAGRVLWALVDRHDKAARRIVSTFDDRTERGA
jgi:hypothetical protein